MGIPQEAIIAQARNELAKTQARLNVCKQVHNDLVAAKTLFEKAGTVGPLDAVKMIAEGLSLFIKTQAGQLEMNIREMEGQAASLTESLKAADSKILRPTHMPPANSGGRQ